MLKGTVGLLLLALGALHAEASVTITPSQNQGNVIVDLGDGKPAHRAFPQLYYNDADQLVLGRIASNSSVATEEKQQEIIDRIEDILAEEATEAKQDTMIARLESILAEEATEAKQDTIIARLEAILAEEATEAKQDAGNASLASLDIKASTLINQTDTLEALLSAGNVSTDSIDSKASTLISQTDGIEGNQATQITNQGTQITEAQTANTRLSSVNTNLVTIQGKQDTLLATVNDGVDVGVSTTTFPAAVANGTYRGLATDQYGRMLIAPIRFAFTYWGKSFTIETGDVSSGTTAEKAFVLVDNPVGSGVSGVLNRITFGVASTNSAVYSCYGAPTITVNGTPIPRIGGRQTSQASPVINVYLNPTASSLGVLVTRTRILANTSDFVVDYEGSFILDPGNKILCTVTQGQRAATTRMNIAYSEAPL